MSEFSTNPKPVELPSDSISLTDTPVDVAFEKWHETMKDLKGEELTEVPESAFFVDYKGARTEGIALSWHTSEDKQQPDYVWLADTDSEGNFVGYGAVMAPRSAGAPFVGDTFTNEQFRREGYARRRLEVMNAVAKIIYGSVLHSSLIPTPEPEAIQLWKKLTEESQAEEFQTERGPRWRFLH